MQPHRHGLVLSQKVLGFICHICGGENACVPSSLPGPNSFPSENIKTLLISEETFTLQSGFPEGKEICFFPQLHETPRRDISRATLPRPNVSRQGKGNIVSLPCSTPCSACSKPRSVAHTIASSQEYSFSFMDMFSVL